MFPGLGFYPPLPCPQVILCCVGNQGCVCLDVSADSLQLGELGWAAVASSVPWVEYLCSEVMYPLMEFCWITLCSLSSAIFGFFLTVWHVALSFFFLFFFFFFRFQSERESGDRNFAIGYYLKEKKVNIFFLKCILRMVCWVLFIVCEDFYFMYSVAQINTGYGSSISFKWCHLKSVIFLPFY